MDVKEMREHFTDPDSVKALPEKCTFEKPDDWDSELEKIREKLDCPF